MVNFAFGEYQVAMSELLLFVIAGAFGAHRENRIPPP